jgi:branched-chain amino acid transport system substrate-binding protein
VAPTKNLQIKSVETYAPTDTDMTVQLTKLKQEPGIQAIFNCGFGELATIVVKNYNQLGIAMPMYSTHALATPEFLRLAGRAAEGVLMATPNILIWDQLPTNDPQRPVLKAYVELYRTKFNDTPNFFAGIAHDSFFAVRQAIQRSGSIDHEKVRDALENGNDFVGVMGVNRIKATDHMGLTAESMQMVTVKDGQWKLIK